VMLRKEKVEMTPEDGTDCSLIMVEIIFMSCMCV